MDIPEIGFFIEGLDEDAGEVDSEEQKPEME